MAAGAVVPAARAQSGQLWRPEDRVLLTAYQELGAVALDLRRVYAASPYGIEVYDFVARRWEPPIASDDGYPSDEWPTALAYDAFLDALWLGTASGGLYAYRLSFGQWERFALARGAIERIVADPALATDFLYLMAGGGWYRLRRGTSTLEPVPPDEVPRRGTSALPGETDPVLEAQRGTLGLDERLRRWPVTDIAPAELPGRYWLATAGGNLLYYDSRRMDAQRFRFGLLSRGTGALASDGPALWFGGDGRGPRRGVARSDVDLQDWTYFEPQDDGAPAGYVYDILPTSGSVWFAASDGLYRYRRGEARWRRMIEGDGLPAGDATALAPAEGGAWVGTRRGLVYVTEAGYVSTPVLFPGQQIHDLLTSRDTLWIASDAGLWLLPLGEREPLRAPRAEEQPALSRRVTDARPAFGELFAITEEALYRFDGARWHGPDREPARAGLGRLHTLAAAEGQLWLAGDGGVARWDASQRLWTYYLVHQDIPEGPVRDVLPAGADLWVSTGGGALRLRWRH